jgi:hypothetical protein
MKVLIGRMSQNTTAIIDFQAGKTEVAWLHTLFFASCIEAIEAYTLLIWSWRIGVEEGMEILFMSAFNASGIHHFSGTHDPKHPRISSICFDEASDIPRARQPPQPKTLTFPTTIAEVVGACMKTQ